MKSASAAPPADFVPLNDEQRSHVSTELMCYHIGRAPQTARVWASSESYPPDLPPIRLLGRLLWPVDGIRKLLGIHQQAKSLAEVAEAAELAAAKARQALRMSRSTKPKRVSVAEGAGQ